MITILTAVVGVNWGDEGKGRMVDLLSARYDVICRFQGGNNAGHTVINDKGTFKLNLVPSGILRDETVNVMGPGMVIDLRHLAGEMAKLTEKGIRITPGNLKISDKAFVCLPYHVTQDKLEEARLQDAKYGSTLRGIAPVYGDKYMKKGIRMGDLRLPREALEAKLAGVLAWKNLTLRGYGEQDVTPAETLHWLTEYGARALPFVTDTTEYLLAAQQAGKDILFEAQLGALRDIDYGIYPFTSSSSTLAAYALIGAGIPGARLDNAIGIMKAYSSCVGEGPFTAELFGAEADALREAGAEYGAATGRPRRVGAVDLAASRYGVMVQGAQELALTKLDVLSYMADIPVCVAYEVDGEVTKSFPTGDRLARAKPVVTYVEGFQKDISACRKAADLPPAARRYIDMIQEAVACPIKYVSVGAGREDYLLMSD